MKPLLSVLTILATAFSAAADSPVALLSDMAQRMKTMKQLRLSRVEAEEAIKRFVGEVPAPLPNPDTSGIKLFRPLPIPVVRYFRHQQKAVTGQR